MSDAHSETRASVSVFIGRRERPEIHALSDTTPVVWIGNNGRDGSIFFEDWQHLADWTSDILNAVNSHIQGD